MNIGYQTKDRKNRRFIVFTPLVKLNFPLSASLKNMSVSDTRTIVPTSNNKPTGPLVRKLSPQNKPDKKITLSDFPSDSKTL